MASNDVLANVQRVWSGIPFSRRVAILALTVGTAVALGALAFWAGRPDYRLLFANLEPADAEAVVRELEGASVPYTFGAGGTSLYVPADSVYRMRNRVSAAGVLKGSANGFELFDKPSFALTDFLQDVNYTRALQGELQRTIMQLEPVAHASVHLARPKESAFTDREQPATASVVLKLRPGTRLSQAQVAGIANLVARSVQSLTPDNVTILDAQGRALTDERDDKAHAPVARQLEVQREMEEYLREKAQSMLDRAFEVEKVLVRVAADLDFQKGEETVTRFDGDAKVPRKSTSKTSETTTPTQTTGAAASTAPGAPPVAASAPSKSTTEDRTDEFAIPETVSRSIRDGVSVKRLAVSVLADESLASMLQNLEGIVKTAVGFVEKRDDFKMTSAAFAVTPTPADDGAPAPSGPSPLAQELIRYGSTVATVIVLAFVWLLVLRRGGKRAAKETTPSPASPSAPSAKAPVTPAMAAAASAAAQALSSREPAPTSDLAALIEKSPQAAGRVLSSWIRDGEPA